MKAKTFLACAAVAFVVSFALGFFWHAWLLADFYEEGNAAANREEGLIQFIALGYGALALLMAWMFPIGLRSDALLKEGARFGALIGLLWTLPLSLIFYGVMKLSLEVVIVDSVWHVVEQGATGVAIAWVYGKVKG